MTKITAWISALNLPRHFLPWLPASVSISHKALALLRVCTASFMDVAFRDSGYLGYLIPSRCMPCCCRLARVLALVEMEINQSTNLQEKL